MKRALILLLALTLIIMLNACSKTAKTALDKLPDDYSYEEAVADGCVVYKNSDITNGQSTWDDFLQAVNGGKKATVRLAFYYTIDDPSRYDPGYYEQIKDEYPKLYVNDLSFDGKQFTIDGLENEDGHLISKTFKYMMKYEGAPKSDTALYYAYTYYVLVNDDTLTWDDIEWGMLSSVAGSFIDHYKVYSNLEFKCGLTISPR
jgi:hypothetical protein